MKNNLLNLFFKNSSLNLISQVMNTIMIFVIRMILLKYLGEVVLGISSTITSLIGALSLADLGFQAAITYRLYSPLKNNDVESINEILSIFRIVYRIIGIVVFVIGVMLSPLLKYIITGVEVDGFVYFVFFFQLINTSISYLLSYKQTLLYADQKDYITKSIQIFWGLICGVIKIIVVIFTYNYLFYLLVEIIQTVITNTMVHIICAKKYPFLKVVDYNKIKMFEIMKDTKNVFASKIATYVYSSTDNVVVSIILGSVHVAFLNNYTMITSQIKNFINALMNPITPMIGRMLVEKEVDDYVVFRLLVQVRCIFAFVLCIPTHVLLELFVSICFGERFIIDNTILWLLVIELYINIVYAACYEFNNAAGLFKEEKTVMIIAALMNIFVSVCLALSIGMKGIIIGTVCSQCFLWITRSYIAIIKCLKKDINIYIDYWKNNFYDLIVFYVIIFVSIGLYRVVLFENGIFKFVICGCGCVLISLFGYWVTHFWKDETKIFVSIIRKNLIRKE